MGSVQKKRKAGIGAHVTNTNRDTIFSFIEKSDAIAIDLETGLCSYPAISPDSGGEGELEKCVFLEGWLRAQGITGLERFDAPDSRAKGGVRPNLVATIPGGEGSEERGRFWIMSHIDVVPPGELSLWKSDPWKLEVSFGGKRITGRGVEDNQQGLTSSVIAALALIKQGIRPSRTVKLLFASDEENGSKYGIGWIIKNRPDLFSKNDLVLIPDAGSETGNIIEIAEKSQLWVKFVTKGQQSHASTPERGANAFLAGSDLAVRLHYGLSEKFSERDPLFEPDYSTFQPTKKEPNVPNINTIPGEDVFYYDMRILPRHPVDDVISEVDRIKAEVEKKHGVTISYVIGQRNESPSTAPDSPLIQFLSKSVEEVYRVKTKNIGIGGGTFASFLRQIGIDCAVWSRLEHTAHQPNEYDLLDNILGDAKVMALMMIS